MYKVEIYIPASHVEALIHALTEIGACRLGNYDHVASFSPIKGCWRPLEGANPYDGQIGELTYGEEMKVETICPEHLHHKAINVIRSIHPYEEPLFHFIKRVQA